MTQQGRTAEEECMRQLRTVVVLVCAACGDGGTGLDPKAAEVFSLEIVSGNEQLGVTDMQLGDSLQVRALDIREQPVVGVRVRFETAGTGTVSPGESKTDTLGFAYARWRLGPADGSQEVTVSVPGSHASPVKFRSAATKVPIGPVVGEFTSEISYYGARESLLQRDRFQYRGALYFAAEDLSENLSHFHWVADTATVIWHGWIRTPDMGPSQTCHAEAQQTLRLDRSNHWGELYLVASPRYRLGVDMFTYSLYLTMFPLSNVGERVLPPPVRVTDSCGRTVDVESRWHMLSVRFEDQFKLISKPNTSSFAGELTRTDRFFSDQHRWNFQIQR
jgi:hypothetical protein